MQHEISLTGGVRTVLTCEHTDDRPSFSLYVRESLAGKILRVEAQTEDLGVVENVAQLADDGHTVTFQLDRNVTAKSGSYPTNLVTYDTGMKNRKLYPLLMVQVRRAAKRDGEKENVVSPLWVENLEAREAATDTLAKTLKSRLDVHVAIPDNTQGTADAEVADARVQEGGKTHATLGEHLRQVGHDLYELNTGYTDDAYLRAYTDKDGRFLWGVRRDGSIEWEKGIPRPIRDRLFSEAVQDDPIFAHMVRDSEGRFLYGVKKDGSFEFAKGVPAPLKDLVAEKTDDPEYLYMIKDAEDHFLFGIRKDGTLKAAKGGVSLERVEETDDPIYAKAVLDAGGAFLYGVKKDGSFDWAKGLPTPVKKEIDRLDDLTAELQTRNAATALDWSEKDSIRIDKPTCALVNFIGNQGWPQTKTADYEYWMEFWDGAGNYFKKRVIFNAQGNSSLGFIKKNGSIDICNDEWIGDDTFSMKIGDWVEQDSFHLKAYYTDFFRGVAVTGYSVFDDIYRSRGLEHDRPWKEALVNWDEISSHPLALGGTDDLKLQTDTGARNFPDGFPCICYLNGEFYGLYSWQLKKHRDNGHMEKDNPTHIWLDGNISTETILNGSIAWGTPGQAIRDNSFEVRNPKNLWCMDGTKYDSDKNGGELIDATSEFFDLDTDNEKTKKQKVITAQVKDALDGLSKAMGLCAVKRSAYEADKTSANLAALKEEFEKHFSPENIIDYLIGSDVLKNNDGFRKNWQWMTYDGKKWYVCPYDLDCIFGNHWLGNQITAPLTGHLGTSHSIPTGYVISYYADDLKTRYAALRKAGVIDAEKITERLDSWLKAFGADNLKKEFKKWPNCPANGDSTISEYWEFTRKHYAGAGNFDSTHTYQPGDLCRYSIPGNAFMGSYEFKALSTNSVPPVTAWRYRDSIYRVKEWLTENIANLDTLYRYGG